MASESPKGSETSHEMEQKPTIERAHEGHEESKDKKNVDVASFSATVHDVLGQGGKNDESSELEKTKVSEAKAFGDGKQEEAVNKNPEELEIEKREEDRGEKKNRSPEIAKEKGRSLNLAELFKEEGRPQDEQSGSSSGKISRSLMAKLKHWIGRMRNTNSLGKSPSLRMISGLK
ncbi:uncharacterized protein LOC144715686 [Wolffia australiana]